MVPNRLFQLPSTADREKEDHLMADLVRPTNNASSVGTIGVDPSTLELDSSADELFSHFWQS